MNIYVVAASLLLLVILIILRRKRAKNKIVRVIDDNCTGCRRCVKRCRHKVLDLVNDETGQHIALKYPERCTACRDCVIVCKFKALELTNRKQTK